MRSYVRARAQRFVFVREDLWTDEKFLTLSTEARLLFMWSWMPPQSNVSGLYKASLADLEYALGSPVDGAQEGSSGRLERALDELFGRRMLAYDPHHELLWVANRVKHAPKSDKALDLMRREVRAAPDCALREAFLARWGTTLGLR